MIVATVQNAGNEQEPQAKEEEVPGTPPQKGQPKIVTPKEHKIERIEENDKPEEEQIDEIVAAAQQEVSNLTTPTTMAGPTEGSTQEIDDDTVNSNTEINSSERTNDQQSQQYESVASRTRRARLNKN
jgi:hypothetical protein